MIHLIVFIIKIIAKAINNNQNTSTSQSQSPNPSSKAPIKANSTKSNQNNTIIAAFFIAIATSCICSINIFSNFIISIILKDKKQILLSGGILALFFFFFVMFYQKDIENKSMEKPIDFSEISFNDTLRFSNDLDIEMYDTLQQFFNSKYAPYVEDTNAPAYKSILYTMCYNLSAHNFDTLYLNNQPKNYTSIDNALYDNNENSSLTTIWLILQEKDRHIFAEQENELLQLNKKKVKNPLRDKNPWVFVILALGFISFIYSIYLWNRFLNRNKKENEIIDDLNQKHSTKPQKQIVKPTTTIHQSTAPATSSKPTTQTSNTSHTNGKININTVDVYNLMTIPALNYSTALLIISERTNNGIYGSLEDIQKRNALSDDIFKAILPHIYLG